MMQNAGRIVFRIRDDLRGDRGASRLRCDALARAEVKTSGHYCAAIQPCGDESAGRRRHKLGREPESKVARRTSLRLRIHEVVCRDGAAGLFGDQAHSLPGRPDRALQVGANHLRGYADLPGELLLLFALLFEPLFEVHASFIARQ